VDIPRGRLGPADLVEARLRDRLPAARYPDEGRGLHSLGERELARQVFAPIAQPLQRAHLVVVKQRSEVLVGVPRQFVQGRQRLHHRPR
jgi:hypothetical protein